MEKYPLELKHVYFTRSIVIAVSGHVPAVNEIPKISPENSINVQKIEGKNNEYVVSMKVLMNQDMLPIAPYFIDMECVALFTVEESLSEEEKVKRVTITGHSVVYGAIRESILWITGRQPFGPLSLGLSILTPQVAPPTNAKN
jgi:hypothetical protein